MPTTLHQFPVCVSKFCAKRHTQLNRDGHTKTMPASQCSVQQIIEWNIEGSESKRCGRRSQRTQSSQSNFVQCGYTCRLLWLVLVFQQWVQILHEIFTALHGRQTRYSDEKAVCLSVRLSVCLSDKRVNCDKTEERSVQIFIPYERSFSPVCGLKFWVNWPPRWSEIADVQPIFARSASAVTPSDKIQLTLIGSAFQWA